MIHRIFFTSALLTITLSSAFADDGCWNQPGRQSCGSEVFAGSIDFGEDASGWRRRCDRYETTCTNFDGCGNYVAQYTTSRDGNCVSSVSFSIPEHLFDGSDDDSDSDNDYGSDDDDYEPTPAPAPAPAPAPEVVRNLDPNGKHELVELARDGSLRKVKKAFDPRSIEQIDPATGENPLLAAAANGNNSVVEFFLEKGAKVDAQDKEGFTSLMRALLKKEWRIVKMLRKHGASISLKNNAGKSAYDIAVDLGKTDRL